MGLEKVLPEADRRRILEFAESEMFDRIFREGMTLVEETAAYLDGPGREESRALDRNAALAYAAESMEITTRMMQAASWLVVQRAVRDGDMTPEEASGEKHRLGVPLVEDRRSQPGEENPLPEQLQGLAVRSHSLFDRVMRLDAAIYEAQSEASESPVHNHLGRLQAAAQSGAFDPMAAWRRR